MTAYRVTRLDMDVEARSLGRQAAITRRSGGHSVAAALGGPGSTAGYRFIFTLGVEPSRLPANCLAVLQNAVAHGVRVRAVNIMAFDY